MIIFDTETTGLLRTAATPVKEQPRMIEFAALKLDDNSLEIQEQVEFLINPQQMLTQEIVDITNLDDDDLAPHPPFANNYDRLCEFFLGQRSLVGHNVQFDVGILWYELVRLEKEKQFPWPPQHFCTIALTYHIKGKRQRLGDLYELVTGEKPVNAHRAMGDVKMTYRIVKWLRDQGMM